MKEEKERGGEKKRRQNYCERLSKIKTILSSETMVIPSSVKIKVKAKQL